MAHSELTVPRVDFDIRAELANSRVQTLCTLPRMAAVFQILLRRLDAAADAVLTVSEFPVGTREEQLHYGIELMRFANDWELVWQTTRRCAEHPVAAANQELQQLCEGTVVEFEERAARLVEDINGLQQ